MYTAKKLFPLFVLGFIMLYFSNCKPETESDFINKEILTTGMDTRVNSLQDLIHFSALQALMGCQDNCAQQKSAVGFAQKQVAELQDLLVERAGIIGPPPPPCPCDTGNCLWAPQGLFSYFVDLKKSGNLPKISVQTLNGTELSSSENAKVAYSPGEKQFAVVHLPEQNISDDAVKMVITTGNTTHEVLVNLKK